MTKTELPPLKTTHANPEKILFTLKLWIFDVYIANFYNSVMHTSVFKGPFDLLSFFCEKGNFLVNSRLISDRRVNVESDIFFTKI